MHLSERVAVYNSAPHASTFYSSHYFNCERASILLIYIMLNGTEEYERNNIEEWLQRHLVRQFETLVRVD